MAQMGAFKSAGQVSVVLTTVSAAIALPSDGESVLVVNTCAVPVAFDFKTSTFAATATSPYVVAANSNLIVSIGRSIQNVTMWLAAFPIGTAASSVYFMRGDGSLH